ncbi:hypothetical protein [Sphingomonas sp.]|uniref:hypothetical protein n=1 Tax=Sphingomonas sp. TaxID=28214 RepID=UPI000DB6F5B1|nr:hypothetical protein [Sphingomonas sp.]PZU05978.1 MAG: hypothetical protein DI605_20415 [Sphingomonas sp.]
MTGRNQNAWTPWNWPMQFAQLAHDVLETMDGAQRVVSARMPTIGAAIQDPMSADYTELGRMVTEKMTAFSAAGRATAGTGAIVRRAYDRNARVLGRAAGGEVIWPHEWLALAETNLAAWAAAWALPAAALAPIHRGVVANRKRLG